MGLPDRNGIGVAGIRRPVFWGFYITNFVFWIGISHAGTLISAILRLTNAGWRKPVTRAAKPSPFRFDDRRAIPAHSIWDASGCSTGSFPTPMSDSYGRTFDPPLVWDMAAIFTYMTGSVLYIYLPLIPT